jgi:hypothetical protein
MLLHHRFSHFLRHPFFSNFEVLITLPLKKLAMAPPTDLPRFICREHVTFELSLVHNVKGVKDVGLTGSAEIA